MLLKLNLLFVISFASFSLLIIPTDAIQESNTLRLFPTDDTFVLGNFTDPNNPRGLQKIPFGDLDVMTTWYVWNYTQENKIFAAVYLKYDLNDISSDEIESATLLLHASQIRPDTFSPEIAIYSLTSTDWSEKDLMYDGGVGITDQISDSTRIEKSGMYEWDITQYVIDNAGSKIGIAAKYDQIVDTGSERVTFITKDSPSSNYYPTLLIKTTSEKGTESKNHMESQSFSQSDEKLAILETNQGNITIEFFPDDAPNHVNNFIKLSESGFYDGTLFHRIIPGFMIQGGDPNTKTDNKNSWGQGGPGYNINAEFSSRSHLRGIVSMARSQDPNSAGSQFFIVTSDSVFLDREYTVFGQVTEGMDVADKIVKVQKDGNDCPLEKVQMVKVTLE